MAAGLHQGFARLPGAGYEAIHPELKGVNPEDCPDIHKMAILADVAPYSWEYNQVCPSCLRQKTSHAGAPDRSFAHDQRRASCQLSRICNEAKFFVLPHTKNFTRGRTKAGSLIPVPCFTARGSFSNSVPDFKPAQWVNPRNPLRSGLPFIRWVPDRDWVRSGSSYRPFPGHNACSAVFQRHEMTGSDSLDQSLYRSFDLSGASIPPKRPLRRGASAQNSPILSPVYSHNSNRRRGCSFLDGGAGEGIFPT
jgi:hypothetical protein